MRAVYSGEWPGSGGSRTNIPAPWSVSTSPHQLGLGRQA